MIALHASRTPAQPDIAASTAAPWTGALLCWLGGGAAALLFFPALRGVDAWFGWMPFWLVVAPLIDLVALRHRWISARLRAGVTRFETRRRRIRRQARPLQRRVRRTQRRGAIGQPTGAQPTA